MIVAEEHAANQQLDRLDLHGDAAARRGGPARAALHEWYRAELMPHTFSVRCRSWSASLVWWPRIVSITGAFDRCGTASVGVLVVAMPIVIVSPDVISLLLFLQYD